MTPSSARRFASFTLLVAALAACAGPVGPNPANGWIAGTLSVGGSGSAAVVPVTGIDADASTRASGLVVPAAASTAAGARAASADVVPGEVIVAFAPGVATAGAATLTVDGVALARVRAQSAIGAALYRAPTLDAAATRAVAATLAARADVRYAHPNYLAHAFAVPNDPFYGLQWHYPAIGLPAAWDLTTGSAGVVAAVVDTGILHSFTQPSLTEPDFTGKVLPGYDFVADFQSAGDGDGRDPDPFDVGTEPHGSHVAGTVGAATNEGIGVAGVDWNARLLPVRVLGANGSGTLWDIVDGAMWAAGASVAGVPANANPAHVINLSLGGAYACTPFEEDAYGWIASSSPRRAVVVVAAGNDDVDAAQASPASCPNVIAVGATDARGFRAPYSNYGSRVDVMAPGGDVTADRNLDGRPDGVLSVVDGGFDFYQGTSMAAPHVAGVVALMKALDPDLTPGEAWVALTSTARPLDATACARPSGADCGFGLIDAAAAVALVDAGTIPQPGPGTLVFDPPTLDFGTHEGALTVALRNDGPAAVTWEIVAFAAASGNPGTMLTGSVLASAVNGSVPAGGVGSVDITIDRAFVTADGAYAFSLMFEVGGAADALQGSFVKASQAPVLPSGPTIVAAFVDDAFGNPVESGYVSDDGFFDTFTFAAKAGANEVIAWVDQDDDLEIDEGDFLGVYPGPVGVAAGQVTSGVGVELERLVAFGGSRDPAAAEPWRAVLEELRRR